MNESKMWYMTNWATILLLTFFFPVGLYLMWKYTKWPKVAKWVITAFFGLMILGSVTSTKTTAPSATSVQPTQAPQQQAQPTTVGPTTESMKANNTPAPVKQIETKNTVSASSETVSQKSAVSKAKSYLNFSGFSHDGLVAQLEYEKFSNADAVYGADNSGANWEEQAAKKAKSYMNISGYSRDGLIDQLKYEKFTQEQAEYGANAVGL